MLLRRGSDIDILRNARLRTGTFDLRYMPVALMLGCEFDIYSLRKARLRTGTFDLRYMTDALCLAAGWISKTCATRACEQAFLYDRCGVALMWI